MRVVTGSAKGIRLAAPPGESVRPTSDRAKEGIFSTIQFEVEGARVLDLFCGSGQLGIEALSRGANWAVFVDVSSESAEITRQNLAATRLADRARVFVQDAMSYAARCKERFDIVFMDPPYAELKLGTKLLGHVALLVEPGGVIFYETARDTELPRSAGIFSLHRRYFYGQSSIVAYRAGKEDVL